MLNFFVIKIFSDKWDTTEFPQIAKGEKTIQLDTPNNILIIFR